MMLPSANTPSVLSGRGVLGLPVSSRVKGPEPATLTVQGADRAHEEDQLWNEEDHRYYHRCHPEGLH